MTNPSSDPAHAPKRRVRWPLLVLLWVWGICVFLVVDLFLTVGEFDTIRPRAKLYRGMRVAAHRMVGEPVHDEGHGLRDAPTPARVRRPEAAPAPRSEAAARLQEDLDHVAQLEENGSFSGLQQLATEAEDPRVRIAALRALAHGFREQARAVILESVGNPRESQLVRKQAARYVGRTGSGAYEALEGILDSRFPLRVRAGAVRGLGDLGTARAAQRMVGISSGEPSQLRAAALEALARASNPDAAALLVEAVRDASRKADLRTAVCKGLGYGGQAQGVGALCDALADPSNSRGLRAAAAHSLGLLGRRQALGTVTAACEDPDPEVARQAKMARTRLQHVRES